MLPKIKIGVIQFRKQFFSLEKLDFEHVNDWLFNFSLIKNKIICHHIILIITNYWSSLTIVLTISFWVVLIAILEKCYLFLLKNNVF